MEAPLYFFKIFTDDAQTGNPAACALFGDWPDTAVLQAMATKAGQVVSAFIVPVADTPDQYNIRWFSTVQEINLCGHGTLAAAALLRQLKGEGSYQFISPYGVIRVTAGMAFLGMELPQWRPHPCAELAPSLLASQPIDYFHTRDLVLVLADEQAVQLFQPDVDFIRTLPQHALIVTAFSAPDSYVLRYFAPSIGIDEDIATGSAQCSLAPYWASKTGLTRFKVRQLSEVAADFMVTITSDEMQLQTQAVALPHLTIVNATIA